ncbi:hypothetical protein EON64_04800 [archaeon]|nr:MAG: hypothetical protein EON64_04800 [archaeon]
MIMTLLSSVADGSNGKAFVAETFEQDPFQTGSWKKSDVDKYADQPVAWMASTTAPERFMEDKGL